MLLTTSSLAPAAPAPADPIDLVETWSDLELCVALYWMRRHRRSGDLDAASDWTVRMDRLLDWRLEHGPDLPLPGEY